MGDTVIRKTPQKRVRPLFEVLWHRGVPESEKKGKGKKMVSDNRKNSYKKFVLCVGGFFILVLGMTLILVCWKDVVALFKGATGIVLALSGLFMLYAVNKI